MTSTQTIKEEIMKEFEEKFDMYNPVHDDGKIIPVWNKLDFENFKSFLSSALDRIREAVLRECKEK